MPPAIKVEDVHKSYGSGDARQAVLRGVSLEIAEGELVALIGQSGSGKSTLLNMIGGLDVPDKGKVTVLGHELGALRDKDLARLRNESIGFIFQAFHLLEHLSVIDNVKMPGHFAAPRPDADARALEALGRVGIRELAARKPGELSGGQKQRVAIARALYGKPRILLCDEPTGNLDSETGKEVIAFFQQLNREDKVTLIIVTHEERVSIAAHRVIRMVDGVIRADEVAA